ncbi:MAG TPA: alpha/beta fold hydrolase, partial [Kofleriaceae bacterium]|nr:alpha/beta fold hydrolase [Kofleriaceae bacterium]
MIAILLHGFTGDRTTWDEVCRHWQPELPAGDQLLAVDLPGHGEGPPVQDGWRANLEAICERVGPALSQAVVVGYSLGARVALGLLAEGLTRRAILIGVNPGLASAERASRQRADAAWVELLLQEGVEAFAARWEAQDLFATQTRAAGAVPRRWQRGADGRPL